MGIPCMEKKTVYDIFTVMKPENEFVPKGTPPCDAPDEMECRVVMKKSTKWVSNKSATNELVEETIERPVNEFVPKGTPPCDAPVGSECRIIMKPITTKVYRTV